MLALRGSLTHGASSWPASMKSAAQDLERALTLAAYEILQCDDISSAGANDAMLIPPIIRVAASRAVDFVVIATSTTLKEADVEQQKQCDGDSIAKSSMRCVAEEFMMRLLMQSGKTDTQNSDGNGVSVTSLSRRTAATCACRSAYNNEKNSFIFKMPRFVHD